jgi:hypothetical protein
LVANGQEGFVSPGMHPEIIGETLERAWSARDRWAEMGQAAFVRADKFVSPDLDANLLQFVEAAAVA